MSSTASSRTSPIAAPPSRPASGRRAGGAGVALLAAGVFALAGCSASASTTAAPAPAGAGAGPAAVAPKQAAPQAVAADRAASAPEAAAPGAVVVEQQLIRTASMFITVEDVGKAALVVRGVARGLGGVVVDEAVNQTPAAPVDQAAPSAAAGGAPAPRPSLPRVGNYGQLTIAVPADKLDTALEQLRQVGTVVQQTSATQDVTTQVADLEARMATKKASIERVRALMAQASNLTQVVELEAQLSAREAELESMQAQAAAIAKKVAMSTVTVTISANPQAATPVAEPPNAFVGGLQSGWRALSASLTVLLSLLGALLPWAVVLGLPGWFAWRAWQRRHPSRRPVSPAAPAAQVAPVAPVAPEREPAPVSVGGAGGAAGLGEPGPGRD